MSRDINKMMPDAILRSLEAFGADLAACRKLRGMTQSELARRVGVNRRTVVNMEAGDPSVSLGRYLGAAWVMGLEGNILSAFSPERDPSFARRARLSLPARVRTTAPEGFDGDSLDF